MTALMYALANSTEEIIMKILEYEPNPMARDTCGRTAMHYVCRSGNVANLRLLLSTESFRESFESQSNGGVTPLMCAV